MQSGQEAASLPGPCHSTPPPPPQPDDSYFSTLTQMDDSYFSAEAFLDDSNQHMSSLAEEMLFEPTPVNMCTDDYWHCQFFAPHDDVDANMDCTLQQFESLFQSNIEYHANTASSACGSNMQTSLFGDDASSLPTNQPCMHDHSPEHPDAYSYMTGEPVSSLNASFSQMPTYGNDHTANSEASGDNFFGGEVSSFTPLASTPSYGLNAAMARGDPSLLNMGAGAHVFQQHPQASNHKRATRGMQGSEDSVGFLVKNGTPTIDDGYVWRKYGQKNIKHKIHPRAYFRCANPQCPIKKHIESSSDIEGSVIITYIGRHNHPS